MTLKRICVTAAVACSVSGCAFMFGSAGVRWESLNPGPLPEYESAKQQAMEAITETLKDPDSAQFKSWTPFFKTLYNYGLGSGRGEPLWELCALVNAKNSYGGYTGFEWHYVKFRNGKAVRDSLGVGQSEYDCTKGPADRTRRAPT